MYIKPYGGKIQIEVDEPKVGGLDLSSKQSAVECGTVASVGSVVNGLKVGDKIFFKAWALDLITYEGKTYYFIDANSEGICAIIN